MKRLSYKRVIKPEDEEQTILDLGEDPPRKSTISAEEVDAIMKRAMEENRELRKVLDGVFCLPPTARTLVLR